MMEYQKFRKKPVVIEALQWTGENEKEIKEFTEGKAVFDVRTGSSSDGEGHLQRYIQLIIPTLEGNHRALIGDWIIRGVRKEYYPCRKDIFYETYEEVFE